MDSTMNSMEKSQVIDKISQSLDDDIIPVKQNDISLNSDNIIKLKETLSKRLFNKNY